MFCAHDLFSFRSIGLGSVGVSHHWRMLHQHYTPLVYHCENCMFEYVGFKAYTAHLTGGILHKTVNDSGKLGYIKSYLGHLTAGLYDTIVAHDICVVCV